jgi:plastocyanin
MPMTVCSKSLFAGFAAALSICCANAQSTGPTAKFIGIDWEKAEIVTVRMADYAFSPRRVTFHYGVPTRLRLVNTSADIHDFTAPNFFQTVDLRDPTSMGSSGVGIVVEPHQQRDIDLIARRRGDFALICADHDWAGMTASIVVE